MEACPLPLTILPLVGLLCRKLQLDFLAAAILPVFFAHSASNWDATCLTASTMYAFWEKALATNTTF